MPTTGAMAAKPDKPSASPPSKLAGFKSRLIKEFNDIGSRQWYAPTPEAQAAKREDQALANAQASTLRQIADLKAIQKTHEALMHQAPLGFDSESVSRTQQHQARMQELLAENHSLEQRKTEITANREQMARRERELEHLRYLESATGRQREQEADRIRQSLSPNHLQVRPLSHPLPHASPFPAILSTHSGTPICSHLLMRNAKQAWLVPA